MFGLHPMVMMAVVAITLAASFVKGAIGFAMPMIMISGFASVLPAEQALAALILPTVVSNLFQAFRQGIAPAFGAVRDWWRLIATTCVFIAISSQLIRSVPQALLLGALGVPIMIFALTQLAGLQIRYHADNRPMAEVLTGAVGGFYGGLSGVWGPPTIALLISTGTEKTESVRVQGVVYLIGAVMLLFAHLQSGVLNTQTLPLSAALVVPTLIGMATGFRLHDRLEAMRFRHGTLVILTLIGANLIRQALMM
ncbi:sulfite exporter TauE/SafE [mine drainage metagenome]|uniref:Sulfite exporter TauE/SafE n=1 Tax=mine drainage metagenome TaxID=410659 RepID=A0A1J5Q7B3_9ZZZZ